MVTAHADYGRLVGSRSNGMVSKGSWKTLTQTSRLRDETYKHYQSENRRRHILLVMAFLYWWYNVSTWSLSTTPSCLSGGDRQVSSLRILRVLIQVLLAKCPITRLSTLHSPLSPISSMNHLQWDIPTKYPSSNLSGGRVLLLCRLAVPSNSTAMR